MIQKKIKITQYILDNKQTIDPKLTSQFHDHELFID